MPGTEGGMVGMMYTGVSSRFFSVLTVCDDASPKMAGTATMSNPSLFTCSRAIKVSRTLPDSMTRAMLAERISVGLWRNRSNSGNEMETIWHEALSVSKESATNLVLKSRKPVMLTSNIFLPFNSSGDSSVVKSSSVSHVGRVVPMGEMR